MTRRASPSPPVDSTSAPPRLRRGRGQMPYIVLAIAMAMTLIASAYVASSLQTRQRLRFRAAVHRVQSRLNARLDTYVAMLRATDGLFAARFPVLPSEFKMYAAQLNLRKNYPGVFGIGFAVRYDLKSKDGFVGFMRNAVGVKNFTVWPDDSSQDEHTAIVYLEPLDERNGKAIGYDMYTNETRRLAMQRARDTGQAAASGRIALVQDRDDKTRQYGFLILMPVYQGGAVPPTVDERRKSLRGYVYSPFRIGDLLADVLAEEAGSDLDVRIYDGDHRDESALLYLNADAQADEAVNPDLQSIEQLDVAGRPWTIAIAAGKTFHTTAARFTPLIVGVLGAAASLGLFWLLRGLVRARDQAEQTTSELRQSQLQLQRSENKLRRLVDSNLIGVVFCKLSGPIQDANEEYFRLLGRSRQETIRDVKWRDITPPEYRPIDEDAMRELHTTGICAPFEKEYIRPDGSRVPILIGVAMLENSDDDCVAFTIDLTEQKKAQEELKQAKETAEAANRLKDEFLATLSHELRTPLNAILGWAQLLGHDPSVVSDEVKRGIDIIERNARVQAKLIEDLLDVSRILAGKLKMEAQAVNLAHVVDAALSAVRLAAEAKEIALVSQIASDVPPVRGDPNRLQQVVWNLLTNAIKFTPRNGRVEITLAPANDDQAEITVTDTGRGISPDFLPHMFERFRQADASTTRKHGGLGLGLAIARHLIEQHGGTIRAESEGENKGARFTVSLPIARRGSDVSATSSPSAPSHDINPASPPSIGALQNRHVLVVDDEPDARELIERILAEHGATVTAADSGHSALDFLRHDRADLLILDIGMPDMDGYMLLSRIRALSGSNGQPIPAIALTAFARAEEKRKALEAGFAAHLPKPTDARQLIAAIASVSSSRGNV